MENSPEPVKTVVIGSSYAGSSTVYAVLDVLASVGRDWQILHRSKPAPARFDAALQTLSGRGYRDINGRRINPDGQLDRLQAPDLVIIPDVHIDPDAALPPEFDRLADWVRWAYEQGALVASVCSGTLVLAKTGLLSGLDVTTHWGVCDTLSAGFPDINVAAQRILVPAGEGHRIITAGGASAWGDLMLYLINRFVSEEEARRIAKIYLLQPHLDGQLCYASLVARRQSGDKLVEQAQVWLASNYDTDKPVANAARRSGLSERSFLRRFRKATGQSPVAYVQTLRVEEAKLMLETTTLSVDDIANEVGYSEPSSFRTAFRKFVGISASAYRKKWQGLN